MVNCPIFRCKLSFSFFDDFFFPFLLRRRFALGRGRLAVFAFAVFFVLYHLCYENIKHHTDGMEYLSDWTFVLLGAVFGMTAAFSLAPETFASENVADLAVVAHSVVWPTNILSTIGAWYSFVFFPQCVALEGVDNYPWCYLEWYRLSEHGLNMIMLGLDGYFGNVPIRRGDLGHTLVFMAVYTVWTWYLQFTTGKCPYVMFDFNAGWESVAWFNAAMAGVAFVVTHRLYLGMQDKLSYGETTLIAQIPVWQGYAASLLGAMGFIIVAAFCVLRSGRRMAGLPD